MINERNSDLHIHFLLQYRLLVELIAQQSSPTDIVVKLKSRIANVACMKQLFHQKLH